MITAKDATDPKVKAYSQVSLASLVSFVSIVVIEGRPA